FVLGPSLTNRIDSTSIDFMFSMINGKYKSGVPDLDFGIVDVRDVAMAHVLAGTKSSASGRHILVADTLNFFEIMTSILYQKERYPNSLFIYLAHYKGFLGNILNLMSEFR
ncbi:hypothetical protein ACFL2S_13640, partial [Thermodesulfobacteriota bacterium]